MTSEQIAELRKLEKDAFPAPWDTSQYEVTGYESPTNDYQRRAAAGKPGYPFAVVQGGEQSGDPAVSAEDAAFIAAARNALPLLLDERDSLLKALRDAKAKLGDARSTLSHCWAREEPPDKESVDDADAAEDAAEVAIAKAEAP